MAQFAAIADLEKRLGVNLTATEQTDATFLLETASGLIQAATQQTIAQVTGETLTRRGIWADRLRLPQRPVTTVTSLTIDGDLIAAADYYLDGDELVYSAGFGGPGVEIVIVYTHGYATIPDAVKAVCLEMVRRVWVNPGSVQQEVIGGVSTTYAFSPPAGLLLTNEERRTVRDAIRGRDVGTVILR